MKLLTLLVSVGLIAGAQAGCLYDCRSQCGSLNTPNCNLECISRCMGSRCPEQPRPNRC